MGDARNWHWLFLGAFLGEKQDAYNWTTLSAAVARLGLLYPVTVSEAKLYDFFEDPHPAK